MNMVQQVERRIMKRCVKELLAAGYQLSVFDGEEITVRRSTDRKAILAAMRTTDDDYLYVYQGADKKIGWVRFVYGNDGPDVICDYTTNLEAALKPVNDYATTFEDGA